MATCSDTCRNYPAGEHAAHFPVRVAKLDEVAAAAGDLLEAIDLHTNPDGFIWREQIDLKLDRLDNAMQAVQPSNAADFESTDEASSFVDLSEGDTE